MKNFFLPGSRAARARSFRFGCAGLGLALLPVGAALAQAPAWDMVASGTAQPGLLNTSAARAAAVDASGNVFVTGFFTGTVRFGGTQLTSAGLSDVFVAKWDAAAQGYTWAASGGGTGTDYGNGIAVRGTGVFVTGSFAGSRNVRIAGQALAGTGPNNQDVFVAKYLDTSTGSTPATSTFANGWAASGGSTGFDEGNGIAVSGTAVYVTGYFDGYRSFSIGGQALTGAGNSDVFVARYTDTSTGNTPATSSFANGWATSAGGTGDDVGNGIAVRGTGVFVTGYFGSNANARIAGQALAGAGAFDVFVAKYADTSTGNTPATSSFANGWAASAGGTTNDFGQGIAVRGTGVFVTGSFASGGSVAGQVLAGAGGTDVFVAKYVDTSTGSTPATSSFANGWATSAGGTGGDYGNGIAVRGTGVFVTGSFTSNANVRIAGQALAGSGNNNQDVFVARYTDTSTGSTPATSSFANGWAASAGGGTAVDEGLGIAGGSAGVYAVGVAVSPAAFGSLALGSGASGDFLARLPEAVVSSTRPGSAGPLALTLFPNPATAALAVAGAPAGAAVAVFDALGRPVAAAPADATGTALLRLPAGLAAGVYVVRAGGRSARLAVE